MSSINPINVNTQGIAGAYGYMAKSAKEDKEATENEAAAAGSQKSSVSADEVLSFMAQSAVSVKPATTSVDPTKYVDSESADRIAGFMAQFEGIVANNLSAISEEFPNMSEGAKQTLALAQVNSQI